MKYSVHTYLSVSLSLVLMFFLITAPPPPPPPPTPFLPILIFFFQPKHTERNTHTAHALRNVQTDTHASGLTCNIWKITKSAESKAINETVFHIKVSQVLCVWHLKEKNT